MEKRDAIDFMGIGACRSGSTWISECLRQHPDVFFPSIGRACAGELDHRSNKSNKEMDFFTRSFRNAAYTDNSSNYHRGLGWYMNRFPKPLPGKIRGECSPLYLIDPISARLIHDTFPDVKIVAILRNPVDMIHSVYWLRSNSIERRLGKDFEDAIEHGQLLFKGLYSMHLKRYFDVFPRRQMFVTTFDDMVRTPDRLVKDLYGFLGVDDTFVPSSLHRKINASVMTKSVSLQHTANGTLSLLKRFGLQSVAARVAANPTIFRLYRGMNMGRGEYPPMRPETREKLRLYYRDDICRLETLIERDLSRWK